MQDRGSTQFQASSVKCEEKVQVTNNNGGVFYRVWERSSFASALL